MWSITTLINVDQMKTTLALCKFHYCGFSKKIHKFALCVVLKKICGYFISLVQFLGYFWLMRIWLRRIFSRPKVALGKNSYIKICHILYHFIWGLWWFHRSKDFEAMKAGMSDIQPKCSPNLNSCSIKISHCRTSLFWLCVQVLDQLFICK